MASSKANFYLFCMRYQRGTLAVSLCPQPASREVNSSRSLSCGRSIGSSTATTIVQSLLPVLLDVPKPPPPAPQPNILMYLLLVSPTYPQDIMLPTQRCTINAVDVYVEVPGWHLAQNTCSDSDFPSVSSVSAQKYGVTLDYGPNRSLSNPLKFILYNCPDINAYLKIGLPPTFCACARADIAICRLEYA
jgi:hypothetical protein